MDQQIGAVRVVEQALDVLFAIARGEQTPGIRGFAEQLGISKTTLQRILASLQHAGLVSLNTTRQTYEITSKALILAASYQRDTDLVATLRPSMESLRQRSGETVTLSLAVDGFRVTIFQLDSPHDLRLTTQLGKRYPLVVGATGRVLLGAMSDEQRRETISRYAKSGAQLASGESVTIDPEQLDAGARAAAAAGYAQSHSEWSPGGTGIAVPIATPNGELAALSIYGVENRMPQVRAKQLIVEMQDIAARLTSGTDSAQRVSL